MSEDVVLVHLFDLLMSIWCRVVQVLHGWRTMPALANVSGLYDRYDHYDWYELPSMVSAEPW